MSLESNYQDLSLQSTQIEAIYLVIGRLVFLDKHRHIYRQVSYLVLYLYVRHTQHVSLTQGIVWVFHHVLQRIVSFVILARLDFDRNNLSVSLDHEVKFSLPLVIEVEQAMIRTSKSMAGKFLCNQVLVNSSIIKVYLATEQLNLYARGILTCQESYVVLEQFEQVAQLAQCQRHARLIDIVGRYSHTCILQPQETILVARETRIRSCRFAWHPSGARQTCWLQNVALCTYPVFFVS